MSRTPTPAEIQDANDLLPGPDWTTGHVEEGGDDHLILIPGDPEPKAVIRVARRPEISSALPRRMELLTALAPHLPLILPTPLTEVVTGPRTEATAVGQRYVPGAQHPPGSGNAAILRATLEALASVPTGAWNGLVDEPFVGQPHWDSAQRELTLAALPDSAHRQASAVWTALDTIRSEATGLVHGDLAGDNMRWDGERLIGLLDWDKAAAWDPAINLAQLALWHGVDVIDPAAPDARFAARATVWVGHLTLVRVHDAAERQAAGGTVRRWSRLLRKAMPRLDLAAEAVGRLEAL